MVRVCFPLVYYLRWYFLPQFIRILNVDKVCLTWATNESTPFRIFCWFQVFWLIGLYHCHVAAFTLVSSYITVRCKCLRSWTFEQPRTARQKRTYRCTSTVLMSYTYASQPNIEYCIPLRRSETETPRLPENPTPGTTQVGIIRGFETPRGHG